MISTKAVKRVRKRTLRCLNWSGHVFRGKQRKWLSVFVAVGLISLIVIWMGFFQSVVWQVPDETVIRETASNFIIDILHAPEGSIIGDVSDLKKTKGLPFSKPVLDCPIVMITCGDLKDDIYRKMVANRVRYAKKHEYCFLLGKPSSFLWKSKIWIWRFIRWYPHYWRNYVFWRVFTQHLKDPTASWIFYTDMDVIITNFGQRIDNIIAHVIDESRYFPMSKSQMIVKKAQEKHNQSDEISEALEVKQGKGNRLERIMQIIESKPSSVQLPSIVVANDVTCSMKLRPINSGVGIYRGTEFTLNFLKLLIANAHTRFGIEYNPSDQGKLTAIMEHMHGLNITSIMKKCKQMAENTELWTESKDGYIGLVEVTPNKEIVVMKGSHFGCYRVSGDPHLHWHPGGSFLAHFCGWKTADRIHLYDEVVSMASDLIE